MIVDINAWTGAWGSLPVEGELPQVRRALKAVGVERICLSPMGAAWAHNPHLCNKEIYAAARRGGDIYPVPVLDPTLPTWEEELKRALEAPRARLIKLLPAYSGYALAQAADLLEATAAAGLGVVVQTRLEDPRRQHPLAQVPDLPAAAVAQMAAQHPDLTVILGGAAWTAIRELGPQLLELPRFYADISQADGMDSLRIFVGEGLGAKLLFGSHAPFFVPLAGLARVLADLDDESAAALLGGNAERLLG